MRPRSRIDGERGSVAVVVASAVGMALVLTMGAADVGRALIARSRAEAVADLAALARGAGSGFPVGCRPRDPRRRLRRSQRCPARVVLLRRGHLRSDRRGCRARSRVPPPARRSRCHRDRPSGGGSAYVTAGWPFDTISIGSIFASIVPSGATATSATAVAEASFEIRGHTRLPRL